MAQPETARSRRVSGASVSAQIATCWLPFVDKLTSFLSQKAPRVPLRKVIYNRPHGLKANPWLGKRPRFELSGMPHAHCRRSRRQTICTQVLPTLVARTRGYVEYESIIDPHPNGGHRASRSAVRPCRAPTAAAGTTSRSRANTAVAAAGRFPLRQNAAVRLLEAQLRVVWNRALTAIGYVNLDFHLDFRKFNI